MSMAAHVAKVVMLVTVWGVLGLGGAAMGVGVGSGWTQGLCPSGSDLDGRFPSNAYADGLEFCHGFSSKTCCGQTTTTTIASSLAGFARIGDGAADGDCREMWAQLVCAPCDPRISLISVLDAGDHDDDDRDDDYDAEGGAKGSGQLTEAEKRKRKDEADYKKSKASGEVFVCGALCEAVYRVCRNDYFTGDVNDVPMPCREQDKVCSRLSDWFSSGDELCAAHHFTVRSTDEECYGGTKESPWDALIKARERRKRSSKRDSNNQKKKKSTGSSSSRSKGTVAALRRRKDLYNRIVKILGQVIACSLVLAGAMAAAYYRSLLTRKRRMAAVYASPSAAAAAAAELRRRGSDDGTNPVANVPPAAAAMKTD